MSELLLEIDVNCTSAIDDEKKKQKIVMVGFDGSVDGKYFKGKVIGSGVDTQKYPKDDDGNFIEGKGSLSARYMLEGEDYTGEKCRIFIENTVGSGGYPSITTNSKALSSWESALLHSSVEGKEGGVWVRIYKD